MNSTCQNFLAPKQGEAREDCEDSIHPEPGAGPVADRCAFAVSDGTTTSFFSGLWAQILTRRFAANPAVAFDLTWQEWLKDAQRDWQAAVSERAKAEDASFYTRNDFLSRKPAAATFVGLLLDPPTPEGAISWRAQVLGDSCLFILGKDGPRSMDLTKAEEFSNMVKAAESYEIKNPHEPRKFASAPRGGTEPDLLDGDVLLLATDALSKWLLLRAELSQPIWGSVLSLDTQSEFDTFIADARREAEAPLENDDVALVVLKIGVPHERCLEGRFVPRPKPEKPPSPPPEPIVVSAGGAPAAPSVPLSEFGRVPPQLRLRRPAWKSAASWAVRNRWLVVALAGLLALALVLTSGTRRARRDEAENAALGKQPAAQTDQAPSLTAKLAEANKEKTALADQRKQAAEAEKQKLDEAKTKIAQLEADNDAMKKKISKLERQIKELKDAPPGAKPPPGSAPVPPPVPSENAQVKPLLP